MAERLPEDTDLRTMRRRRPDAYPWGKWPDGSAWRLHQGEDFTYRWDEFAGIVCVPAKRARLRAVTRMVAGDPKALNVQFFSLG